MITDPKDDVIHRSYNSLGKITDITNSVGDKIYYVFYNLASQIIQTWVLSVLGGRYLLSSAHTVLPDSCYGKPESMENILLILIFLTEHHSQL